MRYPKQEEIKAKEIIALCKEFTKTNGKDTKIFHRINKEINKLKDLIVFVSGDEFDEKALENNKIFYDSRRAQSFSRQMNALITNLGDLLSSVSIERLYLIMSLWHIVKLTLSGQQSNADKEISKIEKSEELA